MSSLSISLYQTPNIFHCHWVSGKTKVVLNFSEKVPMRVLGLWSNTFPLFCPRLIAVKCISKGKKEKGEKERRGEGGQYEMAMGACNMKRGVQYEKGRAI